MTTLFSIIIFWNRIEHLNHIAHVWLKVYAQKYFFFDSFWSFYEPTNHNLCGFPLTDWICTWTMNMSNHELQISLNYTLFISFHFLSVLKLWCKTTWSFHILFARPQKILQHMWSLVKRKELRKNLWILIIRNIYIYIYAIKSKRQIIFRDAPQCTGNPELNKRLFIYRLYTYTFSNVFIFLYLNSCYLFNRSNLNF